MGKGKLLNTIVSLSVLSTVLFGFTGTERYVELEGFLNGRAEASFRAQDRNVRAVLAKGTRGEILQRKKLASGNYAVYVKTMNGTHSGQSFWVYYNVSKPALKVYEQAPASWNVQPAENRQVAETTRDVGVYKDPSTVGTDYFPPAPARDETQADKPAGVDGVVTSAKSPRLALDQINQANELVRSAGTQNDGEFCSTCIGTAPIPERRPEPTPGDELLYSLSSLANEQTRIAPASRYMGDKCYSIVKKDGSYGTEGKKMLSIMSEPRYMDHFTKNGSLGAFCPKFNQLSDSKKLQAWAWYWQSLGSEESKCNLNQYHGLFYKDKRGRLKRLNYREGWGIWTAEKDPSFREDRGPGCSNIRTFEGQARCAIDTMYQTQLKRGKTASRSDLKYWGPIYNHRLDRQMMPHMRRFTACF